MKISSLFVLYSEKDCEILSRSSKSVDTILTLTPDAYLGIASKYNKVIRSIDQFSNFDHKVIIDKVREIELSTSYLDFLGTLEYCSMREVFKARFHIYMSMYERLMITIPLVKKYYYVANNKIYSCYSKKNY